MSRPYNIVIAYPRECVSLDIAIERPVRVLTVAKRQRRLNMDEQVISRDKVAYLTYSIIDQRGEMFEQYTTPIGYVHGDNSGLFEKIEHALEGHAAGDKIEVTLDPSEGFGEYDPALAFSDTIGNLPPAKRYIGAEIEFSNKQGERMTFRVSDISGDTVTVDANHPLANQTVKFFLNVVSVRDATAEEIASGVEDAVAKAFATTSALGSMKSWTKQLRKFFSRMWS